MPSVLDPGTPVPGGFRLTLDGRSLLVTVLVVLASAAAANVAARFDEVAAALVFMLGVTIAGALGGLVGGLLAAGAAFLIFNFFMTEPVLTLRLASGRDVVPFVTFNLCAIVTGVLAGRLRDRSEAARASNGRLTILLTLSRGLQSANSVPDIVSALDQVADPALGVRVSLFRQREDRLEPLGPSGTNEEVDGLAASLIRSDEGIAAARSMIGIRLEGGEGPVGALVLKGPRVATIDAPFLRAFGGMVALALESAILSERIAERRAAVRTEELKTALLSSVSHDFRTPLAGISASASSLLEYRDKLDPDTSERLLRRIVGDCDRLNRYTANLLEMGQIEAGGDRAGLQTLEVADMLGVAVQRVRALAGTRVIRTVVADREVLVEANPALFELVLINVLDNAILYSPDGTLVLVSARRDGTLCRISVADQGCGIPHADLDRVFERFHRVSRAGTTPRGTGLGLAIAKGFVEALGGSIEARTPGIGAAGTEVMITLPLAEVTGTP